MVFYYIYLQTYILDVDYSIRLRDEIISFAQDDETFVATKKEKKRNESAADKVRKRD